MNKVKIGTESNLGFYMIVVLLIVVICLAAANAHLHHRIKVIETRYEHINKTLTDVADRVFILAGHQWELPGVAMPEG